ncbi:hypothetical protein CR513_62357, partial [Mucuna pruriens]
MALEFLKLENELVEPKANEESLKGNLNLFNMHLSEQIIISKQNILLPAYGNFVGRFQDTLGKHASEYLKENERLRRL